MELVEMYLHSREIQQKIEAATRPKRESQMFINEPPAEPQHGDMFFELTTERGYAESILRIWDSNRNQWLVVNQASDVSSLTSNRNRRVYSRESAIQGLSARQIIMDEMSERGMINTSAAAQAMARATQPQYIFQANSYSQEDIDEFRRLMQEPATIIALNPGHITMQRIGEDPIEIPVHEIKVEMTPIPSEIIADAQATRTRRFEGTINMPGLPWFER